MSAAGLIAMIIAESGGFVGLAFAVIIGLALAGASRAARHPAAPQTFIGELVSRSLIEMQPGAYRMIVYREDVLDNDPGDRFDARVVVAYRGELPTPSCGEQDLYLEGRMEQGVFVASKLQRFNNHKYNGRCAGDINDGVFR